MNKSQAIKELEDLLYYWTQIKYYNNKTEQEAVKYAIDYMKNEC